MLYFIGYDIHNDRRRRQIARLLEGHGERIHESAFVARLRDGAFNSLHRRITALIHPDVDRLRIYPLCARDSPDRRSVLGTMPADPASFYTL